MKNGWKITALIFILICLAETFMLFYAFNLATHSDANNIKCSNEICVPIKSTAFNYDIATNTCTCYNNGEITHQEILK